MRNNKVIIVPIKSNASARSAYLYTHAAIEEIKENLLRLEGALGNDITTYSVRTTVMGVCADALREAQSGRN